MKKRIITIVLMLALSLSLMACGGSGESSSTAIAEDKTAVSESNDQTAATTDDSSGELTDNTITVGITVDPANLGPWGPGNDGVNSLRRDFYEMLYDKMPDGTIEPVLAKSYSMVDGDAYVYDVEIYDNIYDTAGNHLTADDVVFSANTFIEMNAGRLTILENIEKVSDYVVRMYVKEGSLLGSIERILTEFYIVTEAAYTADGNEMKNNPVGTGRYVLKEYVPGASVTAVRADSYWQEDESLRGTYSNAYAKEIKWVIYTEPAQLAIALEKGDIDIASGVDSSDQVNFINDDGTAKDGYIVQETVNKKIQALWFNTRDYSNTKDVAIRKAIAYAVDSEAIAYSTYGNRGYAAPNVGFYMYQDYDTKFDSQEYYEYDPDEAKKILTDAGYKDGDITVNVIYESTSEYNNIAQLVEAYLSDIGINVVLNGLDTALLKTQAYAETPEYDIYIGKISGASELVNNLVQDAPYYNQYHLIEKDDVYDNLFKKAIDFPSITSECVDTVSEILDHISDNMYLYGLCTNTNVIIANDKLESIVYDFRELVRPSSCIFK